MISILKKHTNSIQLEHKRKTHKETYLCRVAYGSGWFNFVAKRQYKGCKVDERFGRNIQCPFSLMR